MLSQFIRIDKPGSVNLILIVRVVLFIIFPVMAKCQTETQTKSKSDRQPQAEIVRCRSDGCPYRHSNAYPERQTGCVILLFAFIKKKKKNDLLQIPVRRAVFFTPILTMRSSKRFSCSFAVPTVPAFRTDTRDGSQDSRKTGKTSQTLSRS